MTTPASAHGGNLVRSDALQPLAWLLLALLALPALAGSAPPAAAQVAPPEPAEPAAPPPTTPQPPQPPPLVFEDETGPPPDPEPAHTFRLGVELDTNFRRSSDYAFSTNYPGLSPAAGREETVDPGSHLEVSNVSLFADYTPSALFAAHLRFNGVNLYYRNPTSTDHPYDLAELWLRYGREPAPATVPRRTGAYVKIGKFDRAEKNPDHPLESYGLADTAFNLFADVGVEAGVDLGPNFFAKAAVTSGNPLFVRDPDALAGDTPNLLAGVPGNLLNSGLVILYDSHVERFDFNHPEIAAYFGWRVGDPAGSSGAELMAWGRRRTLDPAYDLPGSPIDADLAILSVPNGPPILPFHGNGKQELGVNFLARQAPGMSLFGQFVYQTVAGLARTGVELEGAQRFDLPLVWATGGHQLFPWISPVLRYSRLHNIFANLFPTPEANLAWDWEKYDGGLRLGLWRDIDLTVEYSYNRIYLTPESIASTNEFLATLRLAVR